MARRALPALLALIALVADVFGAHGVALTLVLLAIPAGFALMLECYGDALDDRCGALRPVLAAGGLGLLVLSAALRSPGVVGGVPRLAVSAIVFCLLLYGAALVGALFRVQSTSPNVAEEPEEERLAA